MFDPREMRTCGDDTAYVYETHEPVTEEIRDCLEPVGEIERPLGEGSSLLRMETPDVVVTTNLGKNEIKLRIKPDADDNVKERFESCLSEYLRVDGS
ncbi:hypothetical protein ACEU6E_07335 [Halorutilales archaeon Cl-col2-1]